MVRPSLPTVSTLFLRTAAISRVAGFAVICLNGAHGQSAPSLRPEFEVASVKPHSSSEGSPHVSIAIYTLVAGKDGPKFRAVADDGSAAETGSGGGHQIKAHHISMKLLAATLQGWIGDTVVDATGLTGLYDLNLDFNVDESMSSEGPTVFEAVQRQLGLKLEAGKGPVEVVVIDHVEKPSAN